MPIARFVKNLPGRNSSATYELVFLASQLPPLGSKSYYIERTLTDEPNEKVKVKRSLSEGDEKSISNEVKHFICINMVINSSEFMIFVK